MQSKLLFLFIGTAFLMFGCSGNTDTSSKAVADIGQEISDVDEAENGQLVAVAKKPVGWYARTTVTASLASGEQYTHKSAGVFGELDESSAEKDQHDISSYGEGILQVLFIHPEWEGDSSYFSDYRAYPSTGKQVWTFQVQNQKTVDLSNADLSIDLSGIYDVYKGTQSRYDEKPSADKRKLQALTLVDVDNQQSYSAEELKNANFSMDGKTIRTFRWVLGDVDNADMEPLATQTAQLAVKSVSAFTTKQISSNDKFGLPPE